MTIYTLIKKGEMHPVFCEDFIYETAIGNSYHLFAVMDGCSSGKDSHFASVLFGKALAKVSKEFSYSIWEKQEEKFVAVEDISQQILKRVFEELKSVQANLGLQYLELLSTLILAVYHQREDKIFVISLGDGFVVLNEKVIEIDQNNMPDYLAYHLEEDFEEWFAQQKNIFILENPKNIAIATDGINTFINKHNSPPTQAIDTTIFLLVNDELKQIKNMLNRKFNILDRKYNLLPADDLGIIRISFYPENT